MWKTLTVYMCIHFQIYLLFFRKGAGAPLPFKQIVGKLPNYPNLDEHNNWMAKCLTADVYQQYQSTKTPSGYTLDLAIQTGVDNPGHPFIYTVGKQNADWVRR